MLQIRLLGQFDIRLDGKRVTIPSRAGQSLFAYLALTAGTAHRREKLAGTFWPDTSDESARKYLRQELWRIRKSLLPQTPMKLIMIPTKIGRIETMIPKSKWMAKLSACSVSCIRSQKTNTN